MSKTIYMPQTIEFLGENGLTQKQLEAMVVQGTVRNYFDENKIEVEYLVIEETDEQTTAL